MEAMVGLNSHLTMKRVLVTGATGFIGQYLVQRLLREGYEIRALIHTERRLPTSWKQTVEVIQGDVTDARMMKTAAAGCSVVFHLAGMVHSLAILPEDESLYWLVN